ncbi:F-box protein At5g49610-like [Papaver somniferum]|uniref:F-box protein At5g49610-like n=1 Tax=Papaver somniferum TaxID=3469 RepID=UPI000E6FA9E2|nr:F-box protein At5g49610-like [Papaver somniferum]XP_026380143.1 F-box protein At5g49610-like [Papaver somniferum]
MSSKDTPLWLKENLEEHVNYPLRVLLFDTTACPGHEEGLMGRECYGEEHMVKACSLFLVEKNLTITAARFENQAGLMNSFRNFVEGSVQSLVAKLSSKTVACPRHEDLIWLKFILNKEQEGHSVNFIDRSLQYLLPGTTTASRSNDQVVLKKSFEECEEGTAQLMQSVLPNEVIVFEILTRVSLSALLHQFQWVCRDWHNCIHESKFQLIHSRRTPIASGCFFFLDRYAPNVSDSIRFFPFNDDPSSPPRNPSPSLDFLPSPVAIAGSSPYGSLLCCVTLDKLQTRKGIPIFYICKPATREWRKIPNPKTKFINHGMRIVVTQTYPTLQYKIVRISSTSGVILEYHCEMFDSVTWAWKRLADLKTLSWLHDTFGGVMINGCLHWITNKRRIHVLSIEQEKWKAVIRLPRNTVESRSNRYLLILIDGKIGVLISNNECIELWVLENYYS